MLIRLSLASACVLSLAFAACGGSSEQTGAGSETTPGAAAGEPATPPTSGGETAGPVPTPPPGAEPLAETQPAAPEPPPHGVMIMHKVKDYDAWKTAFEANAAARKEAGMEGHVISRGINDPNLIMVWVPVRDLEKAKAYFADKSQKDQMKQAGVQGKPEILLSNVVAAHTDPSRAGLPAAFLTVKVKDFDAFKAAFESGAQARADQGIAGTALSQDAATPTVAYVYLQSEDPAKLKTFVEAKETKQTWKDAGVIGQAKVTLVQEGEMVMYQ